MSLRLEERPIRPEEYQDLRKTSSWVMHDDNTVKLALKNDLYSVCVFDGERLLGMGRVIGDGAIYFYVQDVVVRPEDQGRGIGNMIMDAIERFLRKQAKKNAFIGLMAAKNVQDFYRKYGYRPRALNSPGMFKIV